MNSVADNKDADTQQLPAMPDIEKDFKEFGNSWLNHSFYKNLPIEPSLFLAFVQYTDSSDEKHPIPCNRWKFVIWRDGKKPQIMTDSWFEISKKYPIPINCFLRTEDDEFKINKFDIMLDINSHTFAKWITSNYAEIAQGWQDKDNWPKSGKSAMCAIKVEGEVESPIAKLYRLENEKMLRHALENCTRIWKEHLRSGTASEFDKDT